MSGKQVQINKVHPKVKSQPASEAPQCRNLVMNVELEITGFRKWSQSFERNLLNGAGRPQISNLIESWILLGNSRFRSTNAKITRFWN
ncbi:hypothetical protein BGV40_11775 [Methanosarcina sp. Ant1]|nr:hypothetical protein BGV40_11775 [Methanosarcina sp. Ant1]